jgi:catechol 2,3-dioxygenase-like lactoylglutathione lyase family enzyme
MRAIKYGFPSFNRNLGALGKCGVILICREVNLSGGMRLLTTSRPTGMPPLNGVLETSLYVANVARAARFYQDVFGLESLTSDACFHALRVADAQVLLLFASGSTTAPSMTVATITPGGGVIPAQVIPPHGGQGQLHLTFAIPEGSESEWEKWLGQRGVPLESRVRWPRLTGKGSISLYLRDLDGHLIELATPGLWASS